MGSRQIVLVSTAGISVLNAGIFWREAKTKRLFSQCRGESYMLESESAANRGEFYRSSSQGCQPIGLSLTCWREGVDCTGMQAAANGSMPCMLDMDLQCSQ